MNNTLFEDIKIWDEIKEKHQEIIKILTDYNKRIENGGYLQHNNKLDLENYYNLLASHIIDLLVNDKMLYIRNDVVKVLELEQSEAWRSINWKVYENHRDVDNNISKEFIEQMINNCFNVQALSFIQEICTQDIVYQNNVVKEISYILGRIRIAIIMYSKGEEEILTLITTDRNISCQYDTRVEKKFEREYSKWGALVRNRLFKQKKNYKSILDKVILGKQSEFVLDYRYEKNACQSALLHINNEENSSCGTGFIISSDGYALTCAHVVEGAEEVEEIDATIINGDGYPVRNEGFEVYDSGYGKVVYFNKDLDIALLKMEHYGTGFLPIEERKILPELGEEVVVFGYPLGYEMPQSNFFGPNISFYKGYVSSNQVWNGNSVTFLDIDVKSGNSGSPVISTKTGKVIGIISGAKVGSRIGLNEKMPYMIPIQHFIKLLNNN